MARRRRASWWIETALIVALAGRVAAQPAAASVHKDCAPEAISALTAAEIGADWRVHHPDSVFDRLAELVRRNAWRGVLDTITTHFDMMPGDLGANGTPMLQELAKLTPIMIRGETDPTARGRDAAPAAHWAIVGDPDEDATDLLRDEPSTRIRVTPQMPPDARRRLCWTAMLTLRVLNAYNSPGLTKVVARLNQLATLWDNYGASSYSQLPWELFLNGQISLGRPRLEPPKAQIILGHPSAGVEVTGGKYPEWRQSSAMALELGGLLFYNAARTSYVGASFSAIATDQSRLGFGPMAHFGRVVKLGYAFRPKNASGQSQNGAVMSVDVFKFVTGVPQLVKEKKLEALGRKVACLRSTTTCAEH